MADDDDPKAGELVTANYGWTKPTVGSSDDQWGGYLNADLDGIDSVVHGIDTRPPYVLPTASTTVLGGVKVDGSTISINGGVISGTAPVGPPVTISDTPPVGAQLGALWWDSVGGQLYTFYNDGNSSQWVIAVNAAGAVPPASTTVRGTVKVDGTTIQAAADGTISAPIFMGDNRIINGDMRIDQRNGGASGTASGYTVDRWQFSSSQANKFTWQRASGGAPIQALGFPYYLGFVASSAFTPAAGDYFQLLQKIEADAVSDFAWGTASAQPVTLSFWAYSSLSGLFSGAIVNQPGPPTRSYPFTFSIPAARVWTKIVVTIPGDTGGTWVLSGNAAGVNVLFDLGNGSNARGPANAWASANYNGVTGSVSVVGTNAAEFDITGVKLEIGSVATPYNRQSLAKSMADCQRYFQKLGGVTPADIIIQGYVAGGSQSMATTIGITAMRAAPTANIIGTWTNTNVTGPALYGGPSTVGFQITAQAAGPVSLYTKDTTTYIKLDAEL